MSERAGIEYELKVTRLANETLGRYYNEQKARAEKAERELAEARATIEQADTTRREWEVRAATSYRDGRAAGLREAAEVCDVVSRTGEQIAWVYAADTLARRIRALVSAAEPRDEGEV